MKVYQRLAADFVAEGVTHIFGIMGDGNMYWMHELDKLGGVKMLEVRHEGAGLGMADGWARVTRTRALPPRLAGRASRSLPPPCSPPAAPRRRWSRSAANFPRMTTSISSAWTRRRSPPAARPASSASPPRRWRTIACARRSTAPSSSPARSC
jgi:hypothetical protein